MSRHKKILITMPGALLDEVDNLAQKQNLNRSEFIREAMHSYITQKKNAMLELQLKKGYQQMSGINLEISEYCLRADNTAQQSYEGKLAECE